MGAAFRFIMCADVHNSDGIRIVRRSAERKGGLESCRESERRTTTLYRLQPYVLKRVELFSLAMRALLLLLLLERCCCCSRTTPHI